MDSDYFRIEACKLDDTNLIVRLLTSAGIEVASAQLIYIETKSRSAFLLEEIEVPEEYRGNGYSRIMCELIIKWVKEQTTADRIEGTVNESKRKLFDSYLRAGFRDRHQKSFFWVRDWEERE